MHQKKIPVPNLFTGGWLGSIATDEFDGNYEIRFGEKSKCAVKVTAVDASVSETVQEGIGTYSYSGDSLSGGKMFHLTDRKTRLYRYNGLSVRYEFPFGKLAGNKVFRHPQRRSAKSVFLKEKLCRR